MKRTIIKMSITALLAVATIGFTACKKETNIAVEDTAAQAVNEQFVNHTVMPTYTLLATKAEQLANQLAALKQSPSDEGVRQACATFLEAREQWEMSEAFLFGAAGDFGIDLNTSFSPTANPRQPAASTPTNGFTPSALLATCATVATSWKWAGWGRRHPKATSKNWTTLNLPTPLPVAARAMATT